MVWGAIAGAVGNFIGNKVSADYSWKRQKRMFDMQTDWEIYKMQNAHQIEMDDLRKAGLNPALSGTTNGAVGSGAPSGTSVQGLNLGNMGSEAITNMNNLAQLDQIKSQTGLNQANTTKARQETLESAERTKAIPKQTAQNVKESNSRIMENTARTEEIKSNTNLINSQTELANTEIEIKEAEAIMEKIRAEARNGNWGKIMAYGEDILKLGDGFANLARKFIDNPKNAVQVIDTYRDSKGREVQKVKRTERKKR